MSLNDIKNRLYEKTKPGEVIENKSDYSKEKINLAGENLGSRATDLWAKKDESLGKTEKKAVKIGAIIVGVILFLVIFSVTFILVRQSMFSLNKMAFEISGTDRTQSGKLVTYEINYKNNNWGNLKNAVLRVNYPESFKPENNLNFEEKNSTEGIFTIGLIKGHTEGKIIFQGRVFNPKGALMYIKTNLAFQPSNARNKIEIDSQIGVDISPSVITLEVLAPQNISAGDRLDYQINYKNEGKEEVENLVIRAEYPEGFVFSNANPPASSENNFWNIGKLSAGKSGKIIVSGTLDGARDNVKSIKVYAGILENENFFVFNEEKTDTKIAVSPLSILQSVNGTTKLIANAGDFLQFKINYKNNGNIGLRDVIITEKLDSPILDYSTLKAEGGNFDTDKKIITWKASGVPILKNLEAGKSGEILFSIKVKEIFPIKNNSDKNFVLTTTARIDSPDIPTPISANKIVSGNRIDIKVNSKLALNVDGFYADQKISNSGPLPPRVGQETTYTIHWKAFNVFNDVADAKVFAILSPGVEMTGKIFPEDARLEYNGRDNSVIWNIGNMSAGTGIFQSPLEVSFQIKIKPSSEKKGYEVGLLGESTFSARDLFTEQNLKFSVKGKTTNLLEDKTVIGKHKVVE